ncbi:hypothetical protein RF11_15446 [Thelohanellus kitauei]|uniref:Uncharacterized protein n=1 Tax=Thelohanellus kitauei TaxID=669202 RepID=A0A0C2IYI3_THEKT|nr:hypothetical protein RF11_15446 [Thelohanellus kitauei]
MLFVSVVLDVWILWLVDKPSSYLTSSTELFLSRFKLHFEKFGTDLITLSGPSYTRPQWLSAIVGAELNKFAFQKVSWKILIIHKSETFDTKTSSTGETFRSSFRAFRKPRSTHSKWSFHLSLASHALGSSLRINWLAQLSAVVSRQGIASRHLVNQSTMLLRMNQTSILRLSQMSTSEIILIDDLVDGRDSESKILKMRLRHINGTMGRFLLREISQMKVGVISPICTFSIFKQTLYLCSAEESFLLKKLMICQIPSRNCFTAPPRKIAEASVVIDSGPFL